MCNQNVVAWMSRRFGLQYNTKVVPIALTLFDAAFNAPRMQVNDSETSALGFVDPGWEGAR